MSKGSKPRPVNKRVYDSNWDEIDWNPIYCFNCDLRIKKEMLENFPELYERYEDGEVSNKECNFN